MKDGRIVAKCGKWAKRTVVVQISTPAPVFAAPHMDASLTPPRPRPALRVGIGAVAEPGVADPRADMAAVRATARAVLAEVSAHATRIAAEYAAVYSGTPQLHCIAIEGEASGLFIADDASALGYVMATVACGTTAAGYRAVVRHADLVVVVGHAAAPADGVDATAALDDLRAAAGTWSVPTITIDPCNATQWTVDGAGHDLSTLVREILSPPGPDDDPARPRRRWRRARHPGTSTVSAPLVEYLHTRPTWAVGGLFSSIVRLVAWERPRAPRIITLGRATIARARADWDALWTRPTVVDPAIATPITRAVSEYYIWADGLANRFATLHRDTSITPYLLAVIAALLAARLGGMVTNVGPVIVAWAVFFLYRHAVNARYHDRWIDYRSLAEQLRQLAFLWPLGRPRRVIEPRGDAGSEAPQLAWIEWYMRAVTREAGVFPTPLTPERVAACRALVLERFIQPQYDYHVRTIARFDAVRSRLHTVALSIFWATMVVATANVATLPLHRQRTVPVASQVPAVAWWVRFATPVAILLPAIGAGIHGFLGQGDFSNLARRSKAMRDELHGLLTSAAPANDTVDAVGDLAEAAAAAMGDEVLNWRVLVRLKAPSLA